MHGTRSAQFDRTAAPGWWRTRGRRFLAAAVITAAVVVAIGWMTELRDVMHGALLAVAVFALLPLILIAGALLLIILVGLGLSVAAALGGDGDVGTEGLEGAGDLVVGGGAWLAPRYYGFLARQRHPVFWGIPAGALLGGLVLWGLIALIVVPGESRTVQVLTGAQADIEQRVRESGKLPKADQLALRDGFGRPLEYRVAGRWKLASWTLTSLGFDGEPSADDLCVSGSTRLARWAETAADIARDVEAFRSGGGEPGPTIADRLSGIRALRCAGR